MNKIFNRVAQWNALRYNRVFSHDLALTLLTEEYSEWLDAKTEVDELDALCDIIYVALGIVWKLNVTGEELNKAMTNAQTVVHKMVNINELNPAYLISTHLTIMDHDKEYPYLDTVAMITAAAMAQIFGMGLDLNQTIEALNIVCDSNDSKTVEKVHPNVKASADKGSLFIAPERRLQELLDRRVNK